MQTNKSVNYTFNLIVSNISCSVDTNKSSTANFSLDINKIPTLKRPFFKSMEINNEGQVKVYFSELMTIPSNISAYDELVLDVSMLQPFSGDKKYFNFTWNATDFKTTYI